MWLTFLSAGSSFLNVAKNPWFLGGAALLAGYAYYNIVIWGLENKIASLETDVKSLEHTIQVKDTDIKRVVEINDEHVEIISSLTDRAIKTNAAHRKVTQSYVEDIEKLNDLIDTLRKKPVYPERIVMKECVFDIKEKPDENDTIFNSVNSIGF